MAEHRQPEVLIVDDDAFIRRPLELFLRDDGFTPLTADDGEACLEHARRQPPAVIVMDVMMPGRDGFAVCELLKRDPATRAIPVILLTGRDEDDDQLRSRAVGADRLITKPYCPTDLIGVVRSLVDRAATPGEHA